MSILIGDDGTPMTPIERVAFFLYLVMKKDLPIEVVEKRVRQIEEAVEQGLGFNADEDGVARFAASMAEQLVDFEAFMKAAEVAYMEEMKQRAFES